MRTFISALLVILNNKKLPKYSSKADQIISLGILMQ